MSFCNLIKRGISTTVVCYGKKNFRKFPLYGKRGTRAFKLKQHENPYPDMPIYDRGTRGVGYKLDGKFITIPEMIPELIVPDLTDCKLKPYVSYRAPDIVQSEFTAEDLFNVIYAPKIVKDFKEGKLREDGSPVEPSQEEKLMPEQAELKAKQTGSDILEKRTESEVL